MGKSLLLACVVFGTGGSTAWAHKLNLFVYAEGATIHGEAYARRSEPLAAASVSVLADDGRRLGSATTDAAGKFRFTATERIDHRFVLDGGDGHTAEARLAAAELPAGLPAAGKSVQSDGVLPAAAGPQRLAAEPAPASGETATGDAAARQIVELRREVRALAERLWFRDVLGGLGFIIGLMGVAMYLLARRRAAAP